MRNEKSRNPVESVSGDLVNNQNGQYSPNTTEQDNGGQSDGWTPTETEPEPKHLPDEHFTIVDYDKTAENPPRYDITIKDELSGKESTIFASSQAYTGAQGV